MKMKRSGKHIETKPVRNFAIFFRIKGISNGVNLYFMPCPHCQGRGLVPSAEKLALEFLRGLRSEILKGNITQVKGTVPINVADYLLNRKRKEILEAEMRGNVIITIEGNPAMQPGESHIICE